MNESMPSPTTSTVERLRQHTCEVRDKNRRRPKINASLLIKVGIRGKRFWCNVNWIREDGALVAIVDNDLLRSPWKVGDEIVALHEHVLETSDPSDMTFTSLLSALRSSEAAMMWRELRLADGPGVIAKPKTFFVLSNIN